MLLKPWLIDCSTSISRALSPESFVVEIMYLLLNEVGLNIEKSTAAIRSEMGALFIMKALLTFFTKQSTLMGWSNVLCFPLQLVFPGPVKKSWQ